MITLRGNNVTHDGWLAGVFGLPRQAPSGLSAMETESWEIGHDMATETGERAVLALPEMIRRGQCIVAPAPREGGGVEEKD